MKARIFESAVLLAAVASCLAYQSPLMCNGEAKNLLGIDARCLQTGTDSAQGSRIFMSKRSMPADETRQYESVQRALFRLLPRGFRGGIHRKGMFSPSQQAQNQGVCTDLDGITLRILCAKELAEAGQGSKLDQVARLCTRGMFGDENESGSYWVLRNFNVKYGEDPSANGRKSVMVVAEQGEGRIVGCCGMELMLLTEEGMPWWSNPRSIIKKRAFISDLVVDRAYRQRGLGRSLLEKCHDIVATQWTQVAAALSAAQRLDLDMQNTYLKVDSENRGAVQLYRQMGYREVARVSEELLVPKSPTSLQEWPVLNIYMQRALSGGEAPFSPFRAFKK